MAERISQCEKPPSGFGNHVWSVVCKIPCSDVLLFWVSQQLNGQDASKICSALSVELEGEESTNINIYFTIVSTWRKNQKGDVWLSDLIHPLYSIGIQAFDAGSLLEKLQDLEDQGSIFKFADTPLPFTNRCDSGVGVDDLIPSPPPIECDSLLMDLVIPLEEENTALANFSEMVSGQVNSLPSIPSGRELYSPDDESRLKALRPKLRELQKTFTGLLHKTYKELKRVSVDELQVYLTQCCADNQNEIPLFPRAMLEILRQANHVEIFVHLSRMGAWYFLNYLLLEDILDYFEISNQALKEQLKSYSDEIKAFKCDTLLIDFLAVWGGRCDDDRSFPGYRSVIAKSVDSHRSFTIANACKLAQFIAKQFSLKELCLRLASGRPGCVIIKWLVPAPVARYMLKVLESGFGPDLLQQGVLQLAVERTVFKSIASHDSLYKLSISKPGAFWQCAGAKQLKWVKQSQEVLRMNKKTGEFHWFEGAKLNVSVNCLDEQNLDNVALLWESDDQKTKEITYRKLLEMTCQIANVLKDKGMNKGDVIVIYMPTMPLAVAAMLACTRIGAVHCVVFSDFNARVLSQRIKEVEAKAIITADTRVICGKHRSLKERVEKALKLCPGLVEFVLMAKRSSTSQEEALKKVNELPCFSLEKEMAEASSSYEPETMDAEDFLFIAYTSGVQGTSKAVYHTQAGFLLYTKLTFQLMFNPGPGDKIGCVSDLGWLGAHCFVVYGPLSNGCTTLLFESTATFPNHGRYWEMVDKLKLTHFLTVPSVLKELMLKDKQSGLEIDKYELGTLKFIATAGEPIPSDVQNWYYTRIGKGKCFFLDIWGQTEIGGIGIVRWEAPEEKRRAYFPQSKSFPLFGVDLSLSTDEERTTKELFLKQPLPGMGKKLLVEGKANSFEQLHYENQQGEYSTNDLIEVMNGEMKVTGRKDRAVFTQGVWLSMPEIADQLRKDHAGTEICDAQVIVCSESHGEDEQGGLCVVLLSSEIPKEKREKFTADTKKSIMSKFNSIIGSKIKVYFLKLVESIKQYLYTATMKTSSIALKQFLNSRQKQGDTSWEVIDETEFLTFCMNEKHLLCYADH